MICQEVDMFIVSIILPLLFGIGLGIFISKVLGFKSRSRKCKR